MTAPRRRLAAADQGPFDWMMRWLLPSSGSAQPWHAKARAAAQRVGLDPRYVRRLRWFYKARTVRRNRAKVTRHLPFVLLDPEPDNFTYQIANEAELAAWTATVARCDLRSIEAFIAEPGEDAVLRARLRSATTGHWLWSKPSPEFGKRLGWYALARAIRPALIIESGVHDGLGSLMLLRALQRNLDQGHPGRLVSFDINPSAGWLVGEDSLWDLRIQSSGAGLPEVLERFGEVGMFIYDGPHSYDDERRDLERAAARLTPDGLLLSDDAQVTRALADLCQELSLAYFEFQEIPVAHFYPGAVLGAGRRPQRAK